MIGWWPSGGVWRHPDFLRLWAAQIASAFGSRITRTALPMVAILTLDATTTEQGVLAALGVAPAMAVGLLCGGLVDRHRKRPLLVGADLFRAALIASVPIAAWLGVLGVPQLCLVAAGVGAATSLFQIADNTFLPTLVGKDLLLDANTRLETTEGVAEATGPWFAGELVQWLTAPLAVGIDALTYLWSAALLLRIRVPEAPHAPPEPGTSVLGDIRAGFGACLRDPQVRPALLAEVLTLFFGGFYLTLYTELLLDGLGLSPRQSGLLIGVGGIGALAGAWLAGPLVRRLGTGGTMGVCLALGLGANLLIPLSLSAGRAAVPLLVVQQIAGDALLGIYGIQAITLRQRVVPEALLGRANATFHAVGGVTLPAGALVSGWLADRIGLQPTLWIAACGALLAVPVVLPLAVRSGR